MEDGEGKAGEEGNNEGGPENGNNEHHVQGNAGNDLENPNMGLLQGHNGGEVDNGNNLDLNHGNVVPGNDNIQDANGDVLIRRDDDRQQPEDPGEVVINRNRLTFKDLDGIRKVADLPLPGLLKLPTGSCEAMLLRVSRNNGFGYVPINEYIRDRQTILDKSGNNGLFLNSHDPSMEALVYKTTVSVPELPEKLS